MATLLEEYIAKLNANSQPYTPLTEQQMADKAKNKYQSIYDQNRLSAQQQYDATKLARDQALATQLEQYALQLDQSRKNYENAQADAVRNALGRGMQRSSYLNSTIGNIALKGNEAQQAILKNQQGTVRNYAEQGALAASQLAAQMAQYDKSQLADQLAYQDELEDREYNRGLTAADRANQIAGDIYNAQLYATEHNLFGYGKGSSGGGGSSSGGSRYYGSKNPSTTTPPPSAGDPLSNLLALTGGTYSPSDPSADRKKGDTGVKSTIKK